MRAAGALGLALGLMLAGPVAEGAWPGLKGLRRVAIEVVFTPDHPQLAPEVVEKRMEDALLANPNAPRPDPKSVDRLRLVVAVREVSGNELRCGSRWSGRWRCWASRPAPAAWPRRARPSPR